MTDDADVSTAVRKANVRLLHDNRNTQVRFIWASSKNLRMARKSSTCLPLYSQSLQYDFNATIGHGQNA